MRLGVSLGLGTQGASGGAAPTPTPTPSRVDSTQGSDTANDGTATGNSTLVATGSNRRVLAICGAGTSDGVNNIVMTLTGTGLATPMTRIGFQGSQHDNPASSFEAYAIFEADETILAVAGSGPYTVNASATGTNTPDKVGFVIASYQDSSSAASPVIFERLSSSESITPTANDSLIVGFAGSSTNPSGGIDFTSGVTQFEMNAIYGDVVSMGDAIASTTTTVSHNATARACIAVLALA